MPAQHTADYWVGSLAMTVALATVDPDPKPILRSALREFLAEHRHSQLADMLRTNLKEKT